MRNAEHQKNYIYICETRHMYFDFKPTEHLFLGPVWRVSGIKYICMFVTLSPPGAW